MVCPIAKRINVGHKLIAQPKILFQDRLSPLPIRPDLVVETAAMRTEVRLEGSIFEPAGVQLRVVIVAAHVIACIRWVQQRRVSGMISNAGSRYIEPGGNLAAERIPGGKNIRRPEDGPIVLRAEIGIARQDERTMGNIAAETVIEGRGMKQRIDIVIACAWSDGKIRTVGRQVGFGFIRPDRIEAFADNVLPDHIPKPASGRGVGGVDVGARAIVGQTIDRGPIGEMLKPTVLEHQVVVA